MGLREQVGADHQGGPSERAFTVADGRRAGMTYAELYRSGLARPRRGVRCAREPADRLERAMAVGLTMSPHLALSGTAAAAFWGIPVLDDPVPTEVVELAAPNGRNPARGRGVRCRRLQTNRWRTVVVDGVRVLRPVDAWASLALVLDRRSLVVAGDALVASASNYPGRRFRAPLAEPEQLVEAAVRWRGSRGCERLRAALLDVRCRVESPMESVLRLELVAHGLPEPTVNHPLVLPGGRRVRLDLAYPGARVGVEYDGEIHRLRRETYVADEERRAALVDAGWKVLYATVDAVRPSASAFAEKVRIALLDRTRNGT